MPVSSSRTAATALGAVAAVGAAAFVWGAVVERNRFTIRTNLANVEVSWQVTGIRKDPWAERNRIQVEVDKTPEEQGFYLNPEVHGQPAELGIDRVMRRQQQ